jgi:uncharacterized SAM-binding protein YcdF (DUF218 family)
VTFTLSKLLWEIARPSTFLLLLALIGTALLWSRYWRVARGLIMGALLLLLLPALLPLSSLIGAPLEDAYPRAPLPRQVTGILVLGGAEYPRTSVARRQVTLGEGGERLLAGLELARRYPDAQLVFSGVTSVIYGGDHAAASVSRELFRTLGVAPERVIIEAKSRNTVENVHYSKALLRPQPGETWIVVTSAAHMARSLGLFAKADWPVLPYPVDYQTSGEAVFAPTLRFAEALDAFDGVAREWVGLVSYRLMGRTEALFPPAPGSARAP